VTYASYRNESTRSSILAGVKDPGDAAAWARFFDTYAGYVFGIARHRGLPEPDADEIVQQVMAELVHGNALSRYDRSRGAFHLWLARRVA
jgi:DNA-directed RNA polymerase specialized sigma24 family protein